MALGLRANAERLLARAEPPMRRARLGTGFISGVFSTVLDEVTTRDYLYVMKAIGVKNLKARLSEHLRAVKAGETILVTERDEVIAELRPARGRWHAAAPLAEAVAALSESGELTAPVLPKRGWSWSVHGLGLSPGVAASLLDDVRSDRE